MALKIRQDVYDAYTDIVTEEIMNTSRLVSSVMGLEVQVNKAIVGDNAFAHSSGIHQDGLLKSRDAYEIINPKDVGVEDMELVLTARSGRHAVKATLEKLGITNLTEQEFEDIFAEFLKLADQKKEVFNHDLYLIVKSYFAKNEADNLAVKEFAANFYELKDLQVISNPQFPSASVELQKGDEVLKASAIGTGPIDALYTAISDITKMELNLIEYKISSISRGKEAQGKVKVIVEHGGKKYTANAADTDVIKASAQAYINAINNIVIETLVPVAK